MTRAPAMVSAAAIQIKAITDKNASSRLPKEYPTSAAQNGAVIAVMDAPLSSKPRFKRDNVAVFADRPEEADWPEYKVNGDPSLENVVKALNSLKRQLDEDDTYLFYFSGHGIREKGNEYLLPPGAQPDEVLHLRGKGLPLTTVRVAET